MSESIKKYRGCSSATAVDQEVYVEIILMDEHLKRLREAECRSSTSVGESEYESIASSVANTYTSFEASSFSMVYSLPI